jgi:hypothetical protein
MGFAVCCSWRALRTGVTRLSTCYSWTWRIAPPYQDEQTNIEGTITTARRRPHVHPPGRVLPGSLPLVVTAMTPALDATFCEHLLRDGPSAGLRWGRSGETVELVKSK